MNIDVSKLAPYAKVVGQFIVGLASVAAVVVAALSDGRLSAAEIVAIIAAVGAWLGGSYVVYAVPNMSVSDYLARKARRKG